MLDPTGRFTQRAQAYAQARPRYPEAAIKELLRALSVTPGAAVVDLGCGTGLSSEAFLRAGCRVIGVEPNEAMRRLALDAAPAWPAWTVVAGSAEATGLAPACADLVAAAQAFHWFDVPGARAEALRILRRPALAALIWNDRRDEGSDFARGYEALIRRHSPDYLEIRHRHGRLDRVNRFFGHERWRTLAATHADSLDFPTLAARLESASYVPAAGTPAHAAMLVQLRELFDATARDGRVVMEFETRMLYGRIEN